MALFEGKDIKIKDMTEDQKRRYKKEKLLAWLARKNGDPVPIPKSEPDPEPESVTVTAAEVIEVAEADTPVTIKEEKVVIIPVADTPVMIKGNRAVFFILVSQCFKALLKKHGPEVAVHMKNRCDHRPDLKDAIIAEYCVVSYQ